MGCGSRHERRTVGLQGVWSAAKYWLPEEGNIDSISAKSLATWHDFLLNNA